MTACGKSGAAGWDSEFALAGTILQNMQFIGSQAAAGAGLGWPPLLQNCSLALHDRVGVTLQTAATKRPFSADGREFVSHNTLFHHAVDLSIFINMAWENKKQLKASWV